MTGTKSQDIGTTEVVFSYPFTYNLYFRNLAIAIHIEKLRK